MPMSIERVAEGYTLTVDGKYIMTGTLDECIMKYTEMQDDKNKSENP